MRQRVSYGYCGDPSEDSGYRELVDYCDDIDEDLLILDYFYYKGGTLLISSSIFY